MTQYVTEVCDRCGNLRSVCSDPSIVVYPQRSMCYITAAVDQTQRRTNQRFGHPDHDNPAPHATDGLRWSAALYDLTPEDDFFGEQALLDAARRQQGVGDEAQPE